MVVRTWPADVGTPWLCETGQEIDAGVPALRVSPGCVANAGIRLLVLHGTPRAACAQAISVGCGSFGVRDKVTLSDWP
jgi:hypothetical protein